MSEIQPHVQALAGGIGPRGTGTPGEAAAADYVAAQLENLGLPLERHTFRSVASQNAFPLAANAVVFWAFAIYPLGFGLAPWISALLALAAAPLLLQAILYSDSLLRPLLPQVTSRNVVTRIEPQSAQQRRVVILAHIDTNRCRLAWQSGMVRSIQPLTALTLGMLTAVGVLYLLGALLGRPAWVWWVSLLPVGYSIGTAITLWRDDQTPFSPGAHDNAASVAVALEVAARLAAQALDNTQVWLAFTGAEETDHAGLKTLLRQHKDLMKDADFIDLEGVGSGDLVYLTRQGVILPYFPDLHLQKLAKSVASRRPELGVLAGEMVMEDECRTLSSGGYRAICIAGCDPATGSLAHWHRASDTPDTVSEETMQRAAEFVMAMLAEIDRIEQEIELPELAVPGK
jgi:hypothetical protein